MNGDYLRRMKFFIAIAAGVAGNLPEHLRFGGPNPNFMVDSKGLSDAWTAGQAYSGISVQGLVSWVGLAGCGAGEEEDAFAGVAGKGGGAFELGAGFGVAAQFVEKVSADSGEKMVARKRGFGSEGVYECEASLRAVGHGDGYGTVEFNDGGWSELGEFGVEDDDAGPIGFGWRAGAGVASGDLGLEEIGAARGVEFMSAFDCGESAMD